MKCDELKVYKVYTTRNEGAFGFCEGADPTDIELEHEPVCLKSDVDKVIAELKEAIEDANANAIKWQDDLYAMIAELLETKRALWLARANRAKEKQQLFHFSLGYEKLCIDGFYDPYSGRRELSPKQWIKAFNKVEVKLLKKAEEYR